MNTYKLTEVKRYTTNKDGTPLISKAGKPYSSIRVKVEGNDKLISGFGNAENANWNVGDTVEMIVEQKGEYLNFSTPKKEDKVADVIGEMNIKLGRMNLLLQEIYDVTVKSKKSISTHDLDEMFPDDTAF